MNVRVILQRGVPGSAVLCSTVVYMFCVSKGGSWKKFWFFYVNGYTRLLRSSLVLLFPLSEVAALVVDPGSGLFSTGFCW